ncbi:hypothetical protein B0I35DRAFT_485198 [Stachybotrys elegans]|uniref:Uncharacterized protein n=1 Tax=Stachybotrys elegans TaxID=80388 RepID=A0A8K0SDN0_9HYPO|nr:hypothetical protein B0I35DRAFT_485198 [Stachybotrys elegans]
MDGSRVSGLADVDQRPPGLLQQPDDNGSNNYSLSFDCEFSAAGSGYDSAIRQWPLALCAGLFWHSQQGIYSVMDPKGNEELGDSYLVINATMSDAVMNMDGSDVWKSVTIQANDTSESVSLQITLCMTAFEAQEMKINATRPSSFSPEPGILWNTSTGTYRTKEVLRQLGAGTSSDSTAGRGIFDLAPRSWQWPERPEFLPLTGGTLSTTDALQSITNYMYQGRMNEAQYSIFAHMATSTADPALALQAYLTTLCAICYYDRFVMFDTAAPSSQVSLVQVTQPLGWSAFISVASLAIQNAWACISQILGSPTEEWIEDMVKTFAPGFYTREPRIHVTLRQAMAH